MDRWGRLPYQGGCAVQERASSAAEHLIGVPGVTPQRSLVGEQTGPTPLLQVHDWTGESPGDASHRLDPRHHQLAELIDVAGFGADDHVIGAGDGLGLLDTGDVDDVFAAGTCQVWTRRGILRRSSDLLGYSVGRGWVSGGAMTGLSGGVGPDLHELAAGGEGQPGALAA
jgi:hypothetical protein